MGNVAEDPGTRPRFHFLTGSMARDVRGFVDKIGGHPIGVQDKLTLGNEVKLGGRRLHCLHEYLDLYIRGSVV